MYKSIVLKLMTTFVFVLISISYVIHSQVASCDKYESAQSEHNRELSSSSTNTTNKTRNIQTYVIVDCGSSGSRVHIYQWNPMFNKFLEEFQNKDEDKNKNKLDRSLSDLARKNHAKLTNYTEQIADYIKEHIPVERHPFTVVYILATAGMRSLEKDLRDSVMSRIESYISSNYKFFAVRASVISGSDEGMFQWISVNAKANRLSSSSTNQTSTFGVIEMGGASVQVAYHLQNNFKDKLLESLSPEARKLYLEHLKEPKETHPDGQKKTYQLFSTTFLGFGSNSARESYLDLLIDQSYERYNKTGFLNRETGKFIRIFGIKEMKAEKLDEMLSIDDPCLPKNFKTQVKKPYRMLTESNQKIGFTVNDKSEKFNLAVYGTGDYNKCKENVEMLLAVAKEEKLNCRERSVDKCTMDLIGEKFIPPEQEMDMLAVSGFYYTTNMLDENGVYKHDKVAEKTKNFCNTPFEQLKRIYESKKIRDDWLGRECFNAIWVDTLLVKGFQLSTDTSNLQSNRTIDGAPVAWTDGYAEALTLRDWLSEIPLSIHSLFR